MKRTFVQCLVDYQPPGQSGYFSLLAGKAVRLLILCVIVACIPCQRQSLAAIVHWILPETRITGTGVANGNLHHQLRYEAYGTPYQYRSNLNTWGSYYGMTGTRTTEFTLKGFNALDGLPKFESASDEFKHTQSFHGMLVGIDRRYDNSHRTGIYFSLGSGRIVFENIDYNHPWKYIYRQQSQSSEFLAGLYHRAQLNVGYVLLSGGLGNHWHSLSRVDYRTDTIDVREDKQEYKTKLSGFVGTVYGEYGLELKRERITLQPFLGLQYIGNRQSGFKEEIEIGYTLIGDSVFANSLQTLPGTRVNFNLVCTPATRLSLFGHAIWKHEFLEQCNGLVFGAENESLVMGKIRTVKPPRDWAVLGFGANYYHGRSLRLFGGYDIHISSKETLNSWNLGLGFAW